jgi:TPR repeat protein
MLDRCADVPRLKQAQTKSLQDAAGVSAEDRRRVESGMADFSAKMEEDCAGIAADDLTQRLRWLDRAAAGGDESAQANYLVRALGVLLENPGNVVENAEEIVRVKAEGMRYLEASAAQGNINALFELAMEYRSNRVVPRDPVMSLGYLLAMQQTGLDHSIDKAVVHGRVGMSDADIARAQVAAQRIYASCCAP